MFCLITGILHFEKPPFLLNEPDVVRAKSSQGLSSANDSNQDDHHGDNQQNMNETAHGVGRDYPQEPQDDQNHSDSPYHVNSPFLFWFGVQFSQLFRITLRYEPRFAPFFQETHLIAGAVIFFRATVYCLNCQPKQPADQRCLTSRITYNRISAPIIAAISKPSMPALEMWS